mgnify:CR=1 FL=1
MHEEDKTNRQDEPMAEEVADILERELRSDDEHPLEDKDWPKQEGS